MSSIDTTKPVGDEPFSRYAYLALALAIQAVVLGTFVASLTMLQRDALGRWPFLVTEFLVLTGICFNQIHVAHDICWRLDIVDVLIRFTVGLLQCVPMLLLGRVPNDILWWFICYFLLTNAVFLGMVNTRLKIPPGVKLPLLKRRGILNIIQLYLLALAIVACFYAWHEMLIGILFMMDQIVMIAAIYVFDRRLRRG